MISNEKDLKYKELILWALRYINSNTNKIVKCAKTIYNQKIKNRVIRLQKKVNITKKSAICIDKIEYLI